ncbi:MAG: lactate utilization protein C [Sulfuricaulis sp.]|uniref:LutC/YkgG family protein n=1 Tax=Sulfuricaulis sp. TaxID=2003553 RepID=UPI0025FECEC2|nr:lactate utilization protein C [Sulfuricaulis sp.]MCR4347510.1 lactate utilization protein C [Sulfuricaulis sp.]
MSARENILARISKARGSSVVADISAEIRRHQRGPIPPLEDDLIKRFGARAVSLASDVAQARTITEVPALVARYLGERQLPMQGVCWPALAPYGWNSVGIELQTRAARGDDLVGVTGAFVGIAETGTLMLLSGPETPATVSLLPETHIAVIESGRIVANMEQAWDRLRVERGTLPRAVNFVSGPSRTADIEQTVTLGAHGPYRVLIIIVG